PWSDFNNTTVGVATGLCCGDDPGDNLVQDPNIYPFTTPNIGSYPATGQTPCGPQAGMGYTGVRPNPGCPVPSAQISGNGGDDNCSGEVDAERSCGTTIVGNVTLDDPVTGVSSAVGAYVGMATTNTSTNASGEYRIGALLTPGTYTIYPGMLGSAVQTKSV